MVDGNMVYLNKRHYLEQSDGTLIPISDRDREERKLASITDAHTVQGVRVEDTSKPDEPAMMVIFTPQEAKTVMAAVKSILRARLT